MSHDKNGLRLSRRFYASDTVTVARKLLGCLLVRQIGDQRMSGIVVEVEAYLAENDSASHSFRGQGNRNLAMFMPAGTLYVYSIHAKFCMNIVTERAGVGAAVLIRAIEPLEGVTLMEQHRQRTRLRDLGSGPSRLCHALAIDRTHDKVNLLESPEVWLEKAPKAVCERPFEINVSPRIGISSAQESPLRFFVDGHSCVSGLARWHAQPRKWLFQTVENKK